ncbi:MAG: glycine oxidase ThiO [Burkholderiales bacterium]
MNSDCLIVGAGAVGLVSALELAKRGARVTVVERGPVAAEASWAGGGILLPLLPWNYREPVTRLTQQSLAAYPYLIDELRDSTGIDPEFLRSGMVVLPPFDAEAATAWHAAHDLPLEPMRALSVAPALAADEEALWLPRVYQLRNPRFLLALRQRVEQMGVKLLEHTPVSGFHTAGHRVTAVSTPTGALHAGQIVITAGAWSRALLGEYALGADIRPVRGQMLLFKIEPGVLTQIVLHQGIYLIPRADGHLLVGSTLEDVGFDKSITAEAESALHAAATAILPALAGAPVVKHWAGLRPAAPGNIPVIARHPHFDNLYLNSGHFRYGVTMAPASAQLLADILLGTPPSLDPAPYGWPHLAQG